MFREPLHPLDVPKVRRVAELLCDISEGRLLTREGLAGLIASIMVCTSPLCSADGATACSTGFLQGLTIAWALRGWWTSFLTRSPRHRCGDDDFPRIADALETDWQSIAARSNWRLTGIGRRGSIPEAKEPARRGQGPNGCARSPKPPVCLVLLLRGLRRRTSATLWSRVNPEFSRSAPTQIARPTSRARGA